MKPIVYDGYCGLGGWSEGFLAAGYHCVGFDIEAHDYGSGGYPGELILRDMRQVHGSLLKDAACLVFSPPCQEPSYRAMPWKNAKALTPAELGLAEPSWWKKTESQMSKMELAFWRVWQERHPKPAPELFIELFNTCYRIQREACEAAGHYIPMVIENVRGAQKWVGRAKANYGSFYLWGDVGMVGNRVVAIVEGKVLGHGVAPVKALKNGTGGSWFPQGNGAVVVNNHGRDGDKNPAAGEKVPGFRFDGSGGSFQSAAVKTTGRSLSKGALKWGPHNMGKGADMMIEIADNQDPIGDDAECDCCEEGCICCHCQPLKDDSRKHDGSGWTDKGSLASHNRLVPNSGLKVPGMNWSDRDRPAQGVNITAAQRYREGVKQAGIGGVRENGKGDAWFQDGAARHGSKSNSRKAASAMIAKIPYALSSYMAQSFYPVSL